jgi:Lysine-specific metallo-endopeptidase
LHELAIFKGGPHAPWWLGSYDAGRYSQVQTCFNAMATFTSSRQVTYDVTAEDCSSEEYAWTYPDLQDGYIWLCDYFFKGFFTSPSEQAQTVTHELSHNLYATEDTTYGQMLCHYLAVFNPAAAANNADNLGYYAIAVTPESPEADNGLWAPDHLTPSDQTLTTPALAGSATKGTLLLMYSGTDGKLWRRWWVLATQNWVASAHVSTSPGNQITTGTGPAIAEVAGTYYCLFRYDDPGSP